jgi:hypothetical protein
MSTGRGVRRSRRALSNGPSRCRDSLSDVLRFTTATRNLSAGAGERKTLIRQSAVHGINQPVKIRPRYGRAHEIDDPTRSYVLGQIVDDVIGMRPDDALYWIFLSERYIHPSSAAADGVDISARDWRQQLLRQTETLQDWADGIGDTAESRNAVAEWFEELMREVASVSGPALASAAAARDPVALRAAAEEQARVFTTAVQAAAEGIFDPGLAPHLARVQRHHGGIVEVHDLQSFAAWALEELLRRGPIRVATCPLCGNPWLPTRAASHCARPAPGHLLPCRTVAKVSRFRGRHPDYDREYRRLYERFRRARGKPDEAELRPSYRAWFDANRPGPEGKTWVKFDDWQKGKRPRASRKEGGTRAKG